MTDKNRLIGKMINFFERYGDIIGFILIRLVVLLVVGALVLPFVIWLAKQLWTVALM